MNPKLRRLSDLRTALNTFAMLYLCVTALTSGCTAMPRATQRGTALVIESEPPGALALYSPRAEFDEKTAINLGKTPILRNFPEGMDTGQLQLSKAGYSEWRGRVISDSGKLHVELTQLAESAPLHFRRQSNPGSLAALLVSVGVQKIGSVQENRGPSEKFESRLSTALSGALARKFQERAAVRSVRGVTGEDGLWRAVEPQVRGVRFDKIGNYPTGPRVDLGSDLQGLLEPEDNILVLIRAKGYYLDSGQRAALVLGSVLATAGSAATGILSASATGAPSFTYLLQGPPPAHDAIVIQTVVIERDTGELLLAAQFEAAEYYEAPSVIESLVWRAVDAIPADLLYARDVSASPQ